MLQTSARKRARLDDSGWPFVGREQELGELSEALRLARAGAGQVVMLIGEPGIGKTRIAEELASIARRRRARVAWGRCWEGPGGAPYWPWAQIIESLATTRPIPKAKTSGGSGPRTTSRTAPRTGTKKPTISDLSELAEIVPALAGTVSVRRKHPRDSEEGRFRLFQALCRFVNQAAEEHPLVLVIDDLHHADRPSLAALEFLARGLRDSRILIVCTYRDTEMGTSEPSTRLAGNLARESRRVVLRGLAKEEVARILEETTGAPASDELVEAICAKTDGNAFFVHEVVRNLIAGESLRQGSAGVAGPADLEVPQGVREMIRSQLDRLSPSANEMLALASVMGRDFDTGVIRQVDGIDPVAMAAILDEACAGYVLTRDSSSRDHFRFSHTLTRETVYDDLGEARRVSLHKQVGEAIERLASTDPSAYAPALAHHFCEAAALEPAKALDYSLQAAEHCTARLAYEDAAGHYELALRLLGAAGDDPNRRAALLLALGDSFTRAGSITKARNAFERAAEVARSVSDAEILARAALGYGGRVPAFVAGVVDSTLVGLLKEALAALDTGDSPLRAILLARLSRALFYAGCDEHRVALSQEALEMARRLDDVGALISALNNRYWAMTAPGDQHARLAAATEMGDLARSVGDRETVMQAHHWRVVELAQRGDMVAADAEIEAFTRLAKDLRQPLYLWFARHFRIMQAVTEGRLDDAECEIHAGIEEERRTVTEYPPRAFLAQLSTLRSLQGRWQEAEALRVQSLDDSYGLGSRAIASANLWLLGRTEESRAQFDYVVSHDLEKAPRDSSWIGVVTAVARTCAWLGDHEHAATLYATLLPYADHNLVVTGIFCGGAVPQYLGMLAATLLQWTDSEGHFEAALAMNARMGARPHLASTQYEYAHMLVRSDLPGIKERALKLLDEAGASARDMGMRGLARSAAQLQARVKEGSQGVAQESGGLESADDNLMCREGEFWTIRFGGNSIRMRSTKGCEYLALLLRNPDQEIHVLRLAGLGGDTWVEGSDAVLDSKAKAAYKRRVEELRAELAEARGFNDSGRVSMLSDELEFFHHELAAAYGLGGRPRKLDDRTEKTRKAVGNRLSAVRGELQQKHPALARHLSASLRMGAFCSYSPDQPTNWAVITG